MCTYSIHIVTRLSLIHLLNLGLFSSHPYPNILINTQKANIMMSILISHVLWLPNFKCQKKTLPLTRKFILLHIFGFSQFQIIFINVNQSPKLITFEGTYKLSVLAKLKRKQFLDDLPKELPLRWWGSFSLYITLLIITSLTTANLDIRWNWQLPMQWQPFNSQISPPLKSMWSSKCYFAKLFNTLENSSKQIHLSKKE